MPLNNTVVILSLVVTLLLVATADRTSTNSHHVRPIGKGIDPIQQHNSPAVIQIDQPADKSIHQRNTSVRYAISVSDPEDGESDFGEIPPDKIFLQVQYVEGGRRSSQAAMPDSPGFRHVRRSDCFNCHQFKGRSIGPSLSEIARRYPADSTIGTLADKIRNGSQGAWGPEIMPAHPDISPHDAVLIAQWIISAGLKEFDDYLPGKEGTFRTTAPAESTNGYFVLTARYDDQGLPARIDLSITASTSITIECK